MSVNGNYSGGLSKPSVIAVGTSATDIVTYEQQLSVVAAWILANTTGSAIQVTMNLVQGASDLVFWVGSIPANSTVIIDNAPIRLFQGTTNDKVTATAASTGVNLTAITLTGSGNATVDNK